MNTVISCVLKNYLNENKNWIKIVHINTVTKTSIRETEANTITILRLNPACLKCKDSGFDFCTDKYTLFYGGCCANPCVGCKQRKKGEHIRTMSDLIVYWHYYDPKYALSNKLWPIVIPQFCNGVFVSNELDDIYLKRKRLLEICTLNIQYLETLVSSRLPYCIRMLYMIGMFIYDNTSALEDTETKILWNRGFKYRFCNCLKITEYKIITQYQPKTDLYLTQFENTLEKYKNTNTEVTDFLKQLKTKHGKRTLVLCKTIIKSDYEYLYIRKCKKCLIDEQKYFEISSLIYGIKRKDTPKARTLLYLLDNQRYEHQQTYLNILNSDLYNADNRESTPVNNDNNNRTNADL
jgi:hypothetical protein